MQFFDVQAKKWKPLPSMAQLSEETSCFCALHVGNYMYVAAKREDGFVNYRYHTVKNTWETLPSFAGLAKQISCLCSVDDHIYTIFQSGSPYRFHISTNQCQCVAKLSAQCNLPPGICPRVHFVKKQLLFLGRLYMCFTDEEMNVKLIGLLHTYTDFRLRGNPE